MILTEFKPTEEVLERLKGEKKIFIMGCGGCPEGAETGGKKVLEDMKGKMEENGLTVTGVIEIDFLCQKALVKSRLRQRKPEIEDADSILVFSCGLECRLPQRQLIKYATRHLIPLLSAE
jgi:hypothetical protein